MIQSCVLVNRVDAVIDEVERTVTIDKTCTDGTLTKPQVQVSGTLRF